MWILKYLIIYLIKSPTNNSIKLATDSRENKHNDDPYHCMAKPNLLS